MVDMPAIWMVKYFIMELNYQLFIYRPISNCCYYQPSCSSHTD